MPAVEFSEEEIAEIKESCKDEFREGVLREMRKIVQSEISSSIRATIREELNPMVQAAITEVFTPVSEFGEPKSGPTTLKECIAEAFRKFCDERVNSDGKSMTDRYDQDKYPTRREYLVAAVIKSEFSTEIREAIKTETVAARNLVKERIALVVSSILLPDGK